MNQYRAPAALVLTLFVSAAPAHAASFDCAQAGTAVEHMICGDEALSKLDELLGDRYVRALRKGEDPKAIKTAQRAWLRDTRNACADAACLKTAYETRIADLTKIGWMTDEKARAICEAVRDAANDGTLQERTEKYGDLYGNGLDIDYDGDGKDETL
ncbi:MAG: lysozyme inhibitor LprI family protein, partial [Alphaproteobacteria bacterium]|nr:lysozyme inhibitor LprI family protein [Alphaproteobacteria bacterium]